MRSKEVEDNINALKQDIYDLKGFLTDTEKEKWQQTIDTVLSYISELEKENKFLRDENNIYKNETVSKKRIRDKIKELEVIRETHRMLGEALLMEMTTDKINMLNKILEKGE